MTGVGTIGGVDVIVSGNDGTVKGGTFYPITVTKSLRIQAMARKLRLPCLYVADTGGAFLPLQSELFVYGGKSFGNQVQKGILFCFVRKIYCYSILKYCMSGNFYSYNHTSINVQHRFKT